MPKPHLSTLHYYIVICKWILLSQGFRGFFPGSKGNAELGRGRTGPGGWGQVLSPVLVTRQIRGFR
jgi:hypothetical protein